MYWWYSPLQVVNEHAFLEVSKLLCGHRWYPFLGWLCLDCCSMIVRAVGPLKTARLWRERFAVLFNHFAKQVVQNVQQLV
jgi:hypothetical protein